MDRLFACVERQGVDRSGFYITLSESLAAAVSYDPVNTPGQCVLPWAGGSRRQSGRQYRSYREQLIFTTTGSGDFGR